MTVGLVVGGVLLLVGIVLVVILLVPEFRRPLRQAGDAAGAGAGRTRDGGGLA